MVDETTPDETPDTPPADAPAKPETAAQRKARLKREAQEASAAAIAEAAAAADDQDGAPLATVANTFAVAWPQISLLHPDGAPVPEGRTVKDGHVILERNDRVVATSDKELVALRQLASIGALQPVGA